MVDPFLSREEQDEFRETEEEVASDEEEESGSSTCKKFLPGKHTVQLLECASSKPLKNTQRRQLLDQFPLLAECDSAYPPKLDKSLILIIPESAKMYYQQLSRL